jgi:hypothetical protein
MLVWLFATLVGGGVVAAGLVMYLRRPQEKAAAHVGVAAEQIRPAAKTASKAASKAAALSTTPTSGKAPHAQSDDDKTTPLQEPVKASLKGDLTAATTEPAPAAQLSPTKPDEPLGIVANSKQRLPDEKQGVLDQEPASLTGNMPPRPDPVAAGDEPTLPVVADVPGGLYAARTQPKTADFLRARGGTIDSQQAVEAGLNWLARHQGTDGHWGADCLGTSPNSRCDKEAPCQGTGQAYEAGHTGLALLAFQAAGHYDFNGQKYSGQVAKGLDYLVQKQAPDGSIVGSQTPSPALIAAGARIQPYFMYEHAMATFALCEACAVGVAAGMPDPRYQAAAQRAVSFIESIQHDDGGWRYTVNASEMSDCSVSGWVMLALKTAREANLSVSPQTISRMLEFFAAHHQDGRTFYIDSQFGAAVASGTDAMTGVGMIAVEFFEHQVDSPIVQAGAAYLADQAAALAPPPPGAIVRPADVTGLPASLASGKNYYLWYNCTMAMFQVGGET